MRTLVALTVLAGAAAWSQERPGLKARELFYAPPPDTTAPATKPADQPAPKPAPVAKAPVRKAAASMVTCVLMSNDLTAMGFQKGFPAQPRCVSNHRASYAMKMTGMRETSCRGRSASCCHTRRPTLIVSLRGMGVRFTLERKSPGRARHRGAACA